MISYENYCMGACVCCFLSTLLLMEKRGKSWRSVSDFEYEDKDGKIYSLKFLEGNTF